MMDSGDRNRGILAALSAGIIWGFLGLFVRGLNDEGLTSVQITCLRYIVVTAVLGIFMLAFHRDLFRIGRRGIAVAVAMGVFGTALNSSCYFGAMGLISLSLSTVLQYIAPFIIVILSVPLFGERMTRTKAASVIMAFAGCVLCTGILSDPGSMNVAGILLGIMSGFFFAMYTIGSKDMSRHHVSPITTLFYSSLVCCAVLMPFSDVPGMTSAALSDGRLSMLIVSTGILMTLLPFGLYNYAVEKIEAGTAAIITYVEPLAATIVGFAFYSESVTAASAAGIAVILLAVILVNRGCGDRQSL